MAAPIAVRIGLRYCLSRRRSGSVSLIAGIAMMGLVLGVALLIVVMSVMNGFDRELRQRILSIVPQISLYHSQGISDWPSVSDYLSNQVDLAGIAPFVELQGLISTRGKAEPVLIYGVSEAHEQQVSTLDDYLADNTLSQLNTRERSVALGRTLANKLAIDEGDKLTIVIPHSNTSSRSRVAPSVATLTVVDIFETQTEVDRSLLVMGLMSASSLSPQPGKVTGLRIRIDDLFQAPHVAQALKQQLPYGFYTQDWTRTHGNIYQAVQLSKQLVGLLLVLIIAIAAFNVVSTLVMVVVDKEGAIAILRTLGATRGEIMWVFIVQGVLIGVLGTLAGCVLGLLLAVSVPSLVNWVESLFQVTFLKADVYPISYVPVDIVTTDVVVIAGVSLLMSFLATIYPAFKAAKVQPAQALRYE